MTSPTPAQLTLIEQQLGRSPRGLISVASSSNNGVPLALKMHPLVDNKPFPTLYWLCSKDLHKAINQLETGGLVKQLEQRLKDDEDWMAAYQANQREYVAQRWANCTPQEVEQLNQLGFAPLFDSYGIGGLRDWQQIRCLHMHYAHHLCGNNVIGQWLDQHYGLNELAISI
ncbi:MAG: DUF501 domain-containing protein [Oceanospirillaceae bacterium]|jgi:hypothetical protein|nr:DUF501 domain-containing protein [Oceanospirillaceae bacterium]MBT4443771.1 DUF501 domain-containing protein [Oceanospirillaceae bacterium]MBT6076537.1 DUF501 domain-containing protein [Oceanospirillaceae bacterium]MBT7329740.1 DUF501 domain-containing protein [Oceanospirillaceae bacterium]